MTERHNLLTETKKMLKSVVNTQKNGCNIQNLDREYRNFIGKSIPFRELGHHSLEDFLCSAKDTILIEEDGKGAKIVKVKVDQKIAHINKFVQQQKEYDPNSRRPNINHGGRHRFSTSHRNYSGSKMPPFEIQSNIVGLVKETRELKLNDFESAYRSKYGKSINVKTYGYETIRDLLSRMKETIIVRQHSDGTFIVSPRNMPLEPITTNGKISHCPKSEAVMKPKQNVITTNNKNHGVPDEIKAEMKEMISKYGQGIVAHSFFSIIKSKLPLFDFRNYGHQSMVSFSRHLPEIFSLAKDDTSGEDILYPKQDNPKESEISAKTVVVNFNANSVPINDLEILFKMVGPFEISKMNDDTVLVTMESVEDAGEAVKRFNGQKLDEMIIKCTLQSSKTSNSDETPKVDVLASTQTIPPEETSNLPIEVDAKKEEKINGIGSTEAINPKDKIIHHTNGTSPRNEKSIPREKLPDNLKENDNYVEVLAAEIFSPNKFYVQLKANQGELTSLMEALDQFYKGNDGLSKDYYLQEDNCKPGMNCAALYYGQWHRGFITKVDAKKRRCGVSYIDYGSIATLPMLEMRLLDTRFAQFPSQAFKCRLSGIKPSQGAYEWENAASREFLKMCNKVSWFGLMAKIEKVLEGEKLHVVKLYDTVTNDLPQGIVINEALVKLNYAEAVPKENEPIDPYARLRPEGTSTVFVEPPTLRQPHSLQFVKDILNPGSSSGGTENKSLRVKSSIAGGSENQKQNVIKISHSSSEDGSVKDGIESTYVESLTLSSNITIHVIVWENKAYMTSKEISELFPKWNQKDVLLKMLKLKKFKSEDIFIQPDEHQELFELCIIEDVRGVDVTQDLNLHPINTVPEYCRLWPALPNACEELMKISNDYTQE